MFVLDTFTVMSPPNSVVPISIGEITSVLNKAKAENNGAQVIDVAGDGDGDNQISTNEQLFKLVVHVRDCELGEFFNVETG